MIERRLGLGLSIGSRRPRGDCFAASLERGKPCCVSDLIDPAEFNGGKDHREQDRQDERHFDGRRSSAILWQMLAPMAGHLHGSILLIGDLGTGAGNRINFTCRPVLCVARDPTSVLNDIGLPYSS